MRLLRALTLAQTPVASGELARRARLGRTSIYPALSALERQGIIEFVGAGAQRQAQFRQEHPLASAILELFAAEDQRVAAFVAALRAALKDVTPPPLAVWLEGMDAEASSTSDTVPLFILGPPKSLTETVDQVTERVVPIERSYGVHFDIQSLTRSELDARANALGRLQEAELLYGVPPTGLLAKTISSKNQPRLHDEQDARARRLAVAIAAKLKSDPGLITVARRQLAKRSKEASAREQRELNEWSRLLSTMSPARLRQFLVEDSERANRLRQSLPGLGLLTPSEREAVLRSSSDEEARAAVARK